MKKELFGVFGDRSTFGRLRPERGFHRVLEGPSLTVGVRDDAIAVPGRTRTHEGADGACVLWGEVYPESIDGCDPAEWTLREYGERGVEALAGLNGSFLAVIDHVDREAVVASDPVRSWECYYADVRGSRTFGTDAAAVARSIPDPDIDPEPLLEFTYFSVVFDDRTILQQLRRIPFDGYVTATDEGTLSRFVYRPREFDYAAELATRLRRALSRRSSLPGRKGLLLSGGYDSRAILAGIPEIDVAYTLGRADGDEVSTARKTAAQYDTPHQTLPLDERYLNTSPDLVRYGQGIMESLHVHHGGYTDLMDVQTIYHGALGDTLFRGHFLPISGVEVFDHKLPPYRLDPDPNVAVHFAEKLGYLPEAEHISVPALETDESGLEFLSRRVNEVLDRYDDRFDNEYDGMGLFGIQNQPTRPFRYHLADQFVESCVPVDAELVEWHLATPPRHRNTRTFLRALRQLDGDVLRHRPPDRPFDSYTLNQIRNFLRRKLPGVTCYEGAWPGRERLYDRNRLDNAILADSPGFHELPWRLKLRVNDVTTWLGMATHGRSVSPEELLGVVGDGARSPTRDRLTSDA